MSLSGLQDPLSEYAWKNRILLIFAARSNDKDYDLLINEMEERSDEVLDRDLLCFEVFDQSGRKGKELLDLETVRYLNGKYNQPQKTFRVILIGKDGTVKLDKSDRVSSQEVFDLIDSMPMRRSEIIKKGDQ